MIIDLSINVCIFPFLFVSVCNDWLSSSCQFARGLCCIYVRWDQSVYQPDSSKQPLGRWFIQPFGEVCQMTVWVQHVKGSALSYKSRAPFSQPNRELLLIAPLPSCCTTVLMYSSCFHDAVIMLSVPRLVKLNCTPYTIKQWTKLKVNSQAIKTRAFSI